jgi:hypothetical protein
MMEDGLTVMELQRAWSWDETFCCTLTIPGALEVNADSVTRPSAVDEAETMQFLGRLVTRHGGTTSDMELVRRRPCRS